MHDKLIEKALYKKAKGYTVKEITEEYSYADGDEVLLKKKVSLKSIPPDIQAVKLIMDSRQNDDKPISEMSDEELNEEKQRLINLLTEKDNEIRKN